MPAGLILYLKLNHGKLDLWQLGLCELLPILIQTHGFTSQIHGHKISPVVIYILYSCVLYILYVLCYKFVYNSVVHLNISDTVTLVARALDYFRHVHGLKTVFCTDEWSELKIINKHGLAITKRQERPNVCLSISSAKTNHISMDYNTYRGPWWQSGNTLASHL